MSMNTVPERLAALRAAMDANGVDLYLIPVGDPHSSEYLPDHYTSLTYFSGFHGENSNFVVTRDKSALWADGRYFVQAEKEIAGTEIELERMGEPGVPTVEQYCADALPEGGVLGLCGLTASCQLVRSVQKALDAKHGTIKTLNLEDELWTEGRPALPETPAWLLSKEYAGFAPAEKLEQLRAKLKELGCTAQLVGKLDNLAWLLNLRAMDIQCTPYAMAYCYVTGDRAVLFINTRRLGAEAAAELKENGVEIAEYDDILTFLAAETEAQTVLADPASVNYAVYETLRNNPVLTVKDEADPLLPMKGVKNETELNHNRETHLRDAVAMVRFQKELEERLAAGEELTELTVDEILHKYRSAQDKFIVESFGTIAAYGGNAAMMHYHATEEDHAKLEKKGFLLVDSGATYMDGTTDITRTYPLGELTEDEKRFYTWTLQCHIDIAKAVWLNYCDGHMLDTIAREPLRYRPQRQLRGQCPRRPPRSERPQHHRVPAGHDRHRRAGRLRERRRRHPHRERAGVLPQGRQPVRYLPGLPPADLCAHRHLACGARHPDQGRDRVAERLPPRGLHQARSPPDRGGARLAGQEVCRHRSVNKDKKTLSVSLALASSPDGGALMQVQLDIKTSPFGRGGIAQQ